MLVTCLIKERRCDGGEVSMVLLAVRDLSHRVFSSKIIDIVCLDCTQNSQVSRIERESHAFRCNLTLSRRHEHFSRIGTFLVGNSQ